MDRCVHGYDVNYFYLDKNQTEWGIECECPHCREKGYIELKGDNDESMDCDVH